MVGNGNHAELCGSLCHVPLLLCLVVSSPPEASGSYSFGVTRPVPLFLSTRTRSIPMKKVLQRLLVATSAVFIIAPSLASQELAQKNACMACHSVAFKMVGPAFKDVAQKYKDQKDAEAVLISNIKKGGSGKWGPIPMPAQASLSDNDAKTLVKWILSTAK